MKLIHQIYMTKDGSEPSAYVKGQQQNLRALYSDYKYSLFDENACREEILKLPENAEIVLRCFDSINAYAFKADIARYAILYLYGGYYYDVAICPEYKFESSADAVLYERPPCPIDTNNMRFIENNFMFFKEPKHAFLKEALLSCIRNINNKRYNFHPLDITSPAMLGRLDTSGITLGETRYITDSQKGAFLNDKLHYRHKPVKYNANLAGLGCSGTNNYEELWFSRQMYKEKTVQ